MFFRMFFCIVREPELGSKNLNYRHFPIFSFVVTCLILLTYIRILIFRYSSERDVTHSYMSVNGQAGEFTMMDLFHKVILADIYLLKVKNKNIRTRCEVR